MTSTLLHDLAAPFLKRRPDIRPGYTVRVHERIQEGGKERIQVFEGLVISVHKGHVPTDTTFTVRRIVSGVGVEKIFMLHSPKIEKIEVKKVAKVRRAKLFFLRGRHGKAARLSERFTTAEEFAIASVPPPSAPAGATEGKEEKKKAEEEVVAGGGVVEESKGSKDTKEEELQEKKEQEESQKPGGEEKVEAEKEGEK